MALVGGRRRRRAGAPVAWNLVDGIHDAAGASERTVWVDGEPREVGPVAFADDLVVASAALRFTRRGARARRENLLVLRSDYEQPFGTFAARCRSPARCARAGA